MCENEKVSVLMGIYNCASTLEEAVASIRAQDYEDWEKISDDGTNHIRVAVYSVPLLLSLLGLRRIRRLNDPMINMAVNASAVTTGIYLVSMVTSGIFIGRLPIYTSLVFSLILLPWCIKYCFTPASGKFMKAVAVLTYGFFFVYQVVVTWGVL